MCLRSFLASSNTHSQGISIPPPGTHPDKKKLQDLALNLAVSMSKILQAFLQDVQESCKNIFCAGFLQHFLARIWHFYSNIALQDLARNPRHCLQDPERSPKEFLQDLARFHCKILEFQLLCNLNNFILLHCSKYFSVIQIHVQPAQNNATTRKKFQWGRHIYTTTANSLVTAAKSSSGGDNSTTKFYWRGYFILRSLKQSVHF